MKSLNDEHGAPCNQFRSAIPIYGNLIESLCSARATTHFLPGDFRVMNACAAEAQTLMQKCHFLMCERSERRGKSARRARNGKNCCQSGIKGTLYSLTPSEEC